MSRVVRQTGGGGYTPTEREPRTAIFLFLRMSPGMVKGEARVTGGGEEARGEWRSGGEEKREAGLAEG